MPSLEVSKKDFERLVGKKFSKKELEHVLEYAKSEVDSVGGNSLKVDCKETNRPDLWSTEGLAREVRARIGKEKGLKKYKVAKSSVKVFIHKNLEKIRPLIVCALVKNVKVDNDFVVQMVQLQEKVGETFGRKRKETGIGLYDFDVMKPPVYYKGYKDSEVEFVPLEWKVPMRPSEILAQHEKGKAYAHLLKGTKLYPIVIDSAGTIASMPPIINSEATGKISAKTKNIFIEVTGFNWEIVETALEVMCMALADRRGKIYSCEMNFPPGKAYPARKIITPEFKTKKISFEKSLIEKKTGLKLSNQKIKGLLERARYKIRVDSKKVHAEYPAHRADILHGVDVVEDLLISYGFNNIAPQKVEMSVAGSQLGEVAFFELVREACVGLGFQEVMTYNLSSKTAQEKNMGLKESFVEIANPVSKNYEIMRRRLAPQLLNLLSKNKSELFPQKVFEVGTTLELDPKAPNGVKESTNLCVALSSSSVNFTDIKTALVSICDYLGLKLTVKKKGFPFMGENSAEIMVNGRKGFVGETSKETIEAFQLRKLVALFEFPLC